jgi:hypothetical protein
MTALADPQASRALLIGVSTYRHLPSVPAVRKNIESLTAALTDEALWGLPGGHCHRLNDPMMPVEVDRALGAAADGVGRDGLLLVYFAGHGLIEPDSGSLYLAVGGTETTAVHATGVPYEWVRRGVRRCRATRRVVILDCCYAGRALDRLGTEIQVADEVSIEKVCVLVAAPGTRTALAPDGEPHTAFTGELLSLISNGLDDGPDVLDVGTIWRKTRESLAAKQRPLPEIRAHNGGDDVPLVRNVARPRSGYSGKVIELRDVSPTAHLLVLANYIDIGSLAVRLDAPTNRAVAGVLAEWSELAAPSAVIFDGGPTDRRLAIAIAVRREGAEAPPGFVALRGRLGTIDLSADPAPVRETIERMRVFCGYYGWADGQLEREIASGSVVVVGDASESLINRSYRIV